MDTAFEDNKNHIFYLMQKNKQDTKFLKRLKQGSQTRSPLEVFLRPTSLLSADKNANIFI